jgi:hypothetical protein
VLFAGTTLVGQNQLGSAGQQPTMPNQLPMTPSLELSGRIQIPQISRQRRMRPSSGKHSKPALWKCNSDNLLNMSESDDVKQFGQKMVEDHTQLGEQIKPIAQHLGVQEPKGPSKKDKQLIAKLEGLSGPQFDEAYIQAMVRDHKQNLKEFKNEAETAQNPALKQTAQQGAGVISQHLQLIEQIAQSHNVATEGKSKSSTDVR